VTDSTSLTKTKRYSEVIERSQHGDVSEDDIEVLVREFFDEFGGDIRGVRPGPARSGGDIFQIDVPDVLSGAQVKGRYDQATFTREVAMEQDDIEFIALDHPLVQSLIEYCLDSTRIQGQVAVKVAEDGEPGPGVLFNYRLGYVSGAGEAVTEKLVSLYVTPEGMFRLTSPRSLIPSLRRRSPPMKL